MAVVSYNHKCLVSLKISPSLEVIQKCFTNIYIKTTSTILEVCKQVFVVLDKVSQTSKHSLEMVTFGQR